ncbi:conjugal transfer protein TraF [Thiomicrospira pelophila]|uniref:conjugal transfer protein TraF n=1 Tax=Thiomicrospira pelophila TaxID=934 RepID=UPI0004A6D62D|nr:conjugal transfer protein TraF [Thiomicrospira pelophila]
MIKRKLLAVAVTGALSSSAMASTFHNAGSILGYGDAGNTHTLFNNFQNPASLGGDTSKRLWGLGASGSIEIEYTGMAGIDGDTESLQNDFDNVAIDFFNNVYADQAEAEAALGQSVDNYLDQFRALGMNVQAGVSVPLVVQTTNWGGFMLAASVTSGSSTGFVQVAPASVTVDTSTPGSEQATATTNAGFTVTGYQMTELTLGYGMDLDRYFKIGNGSMNAGVRFKMLTAGFNHYAFELDGIINDSQADFGDDLSDGIEDSMTFDNTSSAMAVDLGLQYNAKNYMLGVTLENINSPSFDYTAVGTNNAAQTLMDSGYLAKDITLDAKGRVEGAYFSQNRRWTLAGFYDLNKTMAISGLETQKAGVSASYASNIWFAPDLRVGYTNESAGNAMSRIHGGLTVGPISLDLALNSTNFEEFEDNSIAANVAVEFKF